MPEMIYFAALGLVFTALSAGSAGICVANFGHGLKALLSDTGSEKSNSLGATEMNYQHHQLQHAASTSQMRLSSRFDIE